MEKFRITEHKPKRAGDSATLVKIIRNEDNVTLAQVGIKKHRALEYLKSRRKSKFLVELERQLFQHGLTLTDVGLEYQK